MDNRRLPARREGAGKEIYFYFILFYHYQSLALSYTAVTFIYLIFVHRVINWMFNLLINLAVPLSKYHHRIIILRKPLLEVYSLLLLSPGSLPSLSLPSSGGGTLQRRECILWITLLRIHAIPVYSLLLLHYKKERGPKGTAKETLHREPDTNPNFFFTFAILIIYCI